MILLIYRMKFLKEDTWYLGIQSGTGIVGHFENIVICSSAVEILAAGPRLVKKNTVAAQTHRREMSLKSYLSHVRLQNFLYQGQLEASNLQSWSYHPSLPPFPPDKCIQQPGWETGAPLVQSKRMLRGSSAGQLLLCSSLPAYRIQPHQSSIPEDKCMVVTIVLVDSLGLIPFFLAYHLLFAIDYPKLKILALLWEIMNLTRAYGIKNIIAGSRTNCYLHNQILNWCFFLKVAV